MIKPITLKKMQLLFNEVKDRNAARRKLVLDLLMEDLRVGLGSEGNKISLSEINPEALDQQASWGLHEQGSRHIGWSWSEAVRKYRVGYVERLDLAVWHQDTLCGLMLGKVSQGRLVVKINYIQGCPGKQNPLKGMVLPIAVRYLEIYGNMIERCQWIGVQEPLDEPSLIRRYREAGFVHDDPFDPRNNALYRRL